MRAPRRPRASGFGSVAQPVGGLDDPFRVSGAMGTVVAAPVRTRETVLWETPVARATSRMVTIDPLPPSACVRCGGGLVRDRLGPSPPHPFTAPDMKPRT